MLDERGYAANCLKRPRVRNARPSAGARRSEERRSMLEARLPANNDPSVVRADQRADEYLSDQLRASVERAPA
eukprot:11692986-Alexandrium_andersonii.AAC.1